MNSGKTKGGTLNRKIVLSWASIVLTKTGDCHPFSSTLHRQTSTMDCIGTVRLLTPNNGHRGGGSCVAVHKNRSRPTDIRSSNQSSNADSKQLNNDSMNSLQSNRPSPATFKSFFPVPSEKEPFKSSSSSPSQSSVKNNTSSMNKKMNVTCFITYFCNIVVLTSSVVTVPVMATEYNLSPKQTATFCAGVASLASLGGVFGKLVNGFICQYFGGRRSSTFYMVAAAVSSVLLSCSTSLKPVGIFLLISEFLSSMQWTAICHVFDQQYRYQPQEMAKGVAILGLSSTIGALAAKTIGAALLKFNNNNWRAVSRLVSFTALVGATSIHFGGNAKITESESCAQPKKREVTLAIIASRERSAIKRPFSSPLPALQSIFSNPIFWMIGTGHSLPYVARASDRFLGTFIQQVGDISSTLAAGLTSFVTIGFLLGLVQGNKFSKIESVESKMKMVKKSYIVSFFATAGLAICSVPGISGVTAGGRSNAFSNYVVVSAITLLSGIVAGSVSFQFYQFPNLISSTLFPDNSAIALSLTDALAYFVAAGILGMNRHLLGNFGWCTAWTFIAATFGLGGYNVTRAIRPVLVQAQEIQKKIKK